MAGKNNTFGQIIRFGSVGALGAGINLAIYSLCLDLKIQYLIGSFFGWFSGLVTVFFLNRKLTFQGSSNIFKDFFRTVQIYLFQQLVMALILMICVEVAGISPRISYFIGLPVAVMISFLGMKLYAMKPSNNL